MIDDSYTHGLPRRISRRASSVTRTATRRMRAVVQDRELAAYSGIATGRVDRFTFLLGSGLAGVAGLHDVEGGGEEHAVRARVVLRRVGELVELPQLFEELVAALEAGGLLQGAGAEAGRAGGGDTQRRWLHQHRIGA